MKNLAYLFITIIATLSLSGCSKNFYTKANFSPSSTEEMTIAVLPYQVTTTGRIPRKISREELKYIENAESQAFQISLYNQILRRMGKSKKTPNISVQNYSDTNAMLEKAGIELSESWKMTAKELSATLGVDAVVKSSVHKTQYLTDLESYGIFVAASLVSVFTGGYPWIYSRNRTSDVRISSSIVDGKDGTTIWAVARNCPTYWHRNTYDAIEKINYRVTKKIPIR